MQATLITENFVIFDAQDFKARMGQSFSIELGEAGAGLRWFSNNDLVLEIVEDSSLGRADIKALKDGVSLIQLRGENDDILHKTFTIEVFSGTAASLGTTLGTPELK